MVNLLRPYAGWLAALLNVFVLWGINSVLLGYASKILEVNAMVYTCSMFVAASFALLAYAGPGALSKETIRSLDTWGYGGALIIGFLILFKLFALVTAAEGALLQRFSIVATLLTSYFFFAQSLTPAKLGGAACVALGVFWICAGVDSEHKVEVYSLVFIFAFVQAVRVMIAEFHKSHNLAVQKQDTLKTRCRIVGYVMFVVAILFWSVSFSGALVHEYTGKYIFLGIPDLAEFMRAESIVVGLLAGALLAAPIRFLEFYSAQKIKAENFLAITCLGAFATLFWEWLTSPLTGLSLKEFSQADVLAGGLITCGGIVVALGALRRKKQSTYESFLVYEAQNLENVEDSYDILKKTHEHFKGDMQKISEALQLPTEILQAILENSEHQFALKENVLKEVARRYRTHVASRDALTGLLNRAGFMGEVKKALSEEKVTSLLFIDLNKFKPVNDTYGHEAGDEILRGVAKRLLALYPTPSQVTRLGGDEYCILLPGMPRAEAKGQIAVLKAEIEKPFKLAGVKAAVCISASIGLSTAPADTTNPEDLLKLADEGMYREKGQR